MPESESDLKFWKGESLRRLRAGIPCSCGCDTRDGEHSGWAGYITASDADGNGFTLWIRRDFHLAMVAYGLRLEIAETTPGNVDGLGEKGK